MPVLSALLLTAAAAGSTSFQIAATNITVTGMATEKSSLYTEHFAQQLATSGVRVVTQKEIAALLGAERQRQLLGCSESAGSCLAELASALGADGVLLGEVSRLDEGSYQMSLKVVWSRDGRPLTSFVGRAYSESALLDLLARAATAMGADLTQGDWVRLTQSAASHSYEPRSTVQTLAVVPLALGVVAAGLSVFGFVRANGVANQFTGDYSFSSPAEARAIAADGQTMQTLGIAMAATAGVCLVTAAVMYFVGGKSLRATAFWWSPQQPSSAFAFAGGSR